ncbi:MAG: hypothetical protein ACJA02_000728 [Myxococcota bacterium]|jgi:hypothetical protein
MKAKLVKGLSVKSLIDPLDQLNLIKKEQQEKKSELIKAFDDIHDKASLTEKKALLKREAVFKNIEALKTEIDALNKELEAVDIGAAPKVESRKTTLSGLVKSFSSSRKKMNITDEESDDEELNIFTMETREKKLEEVKDGKKEIESILFSLKYVEEIDRAIEKLQTTNPSSKVKDHSEEIITLKNYRDLAVDASGKLIIYPISIEEFIGAKRTIDGSRYVLDVFHEEKEHLLIELAELTSKESSTKEEITFKEKEITSKENEIRKAVIEKKEALRHVFLLLPKNIVNSLSKAIFGKPAKDLQKNGKIEDESLYRFNYLHMFLEDIVGDTNQSKEVDTYLGKIKEGKDSSPAIVDKGNIEDVIPAILGFVKSENVKADLFEGLKQYDAKDPDKVRIIFPIGVKAKINMYGGSKKNAKTSKISVVDADFLGKFKQIKTINSDTKVEEARREEEGLYTLFTTALLWDKMIGFYEGYPNNKITQEKFVDKLSMPNGIIPDGLRDIMDKRTEQLPEDVKQTKLNVSRDIEKLLNNPDHLIVFMGVLATGESFGTFKERKIKEKKDQEKLKGNEIDDEEAEKLSKKEIDYKEENKRLLKEHRENILNIFDGISPDGEYKDLKEVFNWFFKEQFKEFEVTQAEEIWSIAPLPQMPTSKNPNDSPISFTKPAEKIPLGSVDLLNATDLPLGDLLETESLPSVIIPTVPVDDNPITDLIENIDLDLPRVISFFSDNPYDTNDPDKSSNDYIQKFFTEVGQLNQSTGNFDPIIDIKQQELIKASFQSRDSSGSPLGLNKLEGDFLTISKQNVDYGGNQILRPENPYLGVGVHLKGKGENGEPPIIIKKFFSPENGRFQAVDATGHEVDISQLDKFENYIIIGIGSEDSESYKSVTDLQQVVNHFRSEESVCEFTISDGTIELKIKCDKKVFKTQFSQNAKLEETAIGRVYDPGKLRTKGVVETIHGKHEIADLNKTDSRDIITNNDLALTNEFTIAIGNIAGYVNAENDRKQKEHDNKSLIEKIDQIETALSCSDLMYVTDKEKLGIFQAWNTKKRDAEDIAIIINSTLAGKNNNLQYNIAKLWFEKLVIGSLTDPITESVPTMEEIKIVLKSISGVRQKIDFAKLCAKEKGVTKTTADTTKLITNQDPDFQVDVVRSFFESEVGQKTATLEAVELINLITDESKRFDAIRSHILSNNGDDIAKATADIVLSLMQLVPSSVQRSQIACLFIEKNAASSNPYDEKYIIDNIKMLVKGIDINLDDGENSKESRLRIINKWIESTSPTFEKVEGLMKKFGGDPQFQASIAGSWIKANQVDFKNKVVEVKSFIKEISDSDVTGVDKRQYQLNIAKQWIESKPDDVSTLIDGLDCDLQYNILHFCVKKGPSGVEPLAIKAINIEALLVKIDNYDDKANIFSEWLVTEARKNDGFKVIKGFLVQITGDDEKIKKLKLEIIAKWFESANKITDVNAVGGLMDEFQDDPHFQASIAFLHIEKKYPVLTTQDPKSYSDADVADMISLVNKVDIVFGAKKDSEELRLGVIKKFIDLSNPDAETIGKVMDKFTNNPEFQFNIASMWLGSAAGKKSNAITVKGLMGKIVIANKDDDQTKENKRIYKLGIAHQSIQEKNLEAKYVGNLAVSITVLDTGITQSDIIQLYLERDDMQYVNLRGVNNSMKSSNNETVTNENRLKICKIFFDKKVDNEVDFDDFKEFFDSFKMPIVDDDLLKEYQKQRLGAIKLYFEHEKDGKKPIPLATVKGLMDEFDKEEDKLGVAKLWMNLTTKQAYDVANKFDKGAPGDRIAHAYLPSIEEVGKLIDIITPVGFDAVKVREAEDLMLGVAIIFADPNKYDITTTEHLSITIDQNDIYPGNDKNLNPVLKLARHKDVFEIFNREKNIPSGDTQVTAVVKVQTAKGRE